MSQSTEKTRETLSFSEAFAALRNGARIARGAWAGAGVNQYLALQLPDEHSKMTKPYIYIKTVDGGLAPWNPTQVSLFGDDWFRV